jgi:flagellar protein FliS
MNLATAYSARQRYREMGAEAAITDASPHRLIRLLLQGALDRITAAKGHLQRGETALKCECIGKAIDIVGGLRGALDHERGGEIAANLQAIYDYSELRLLEANYKNDPARLDEVTRLLGEIRSAWDDIAPTGVAAE